MKVFLSFLSPWLPGYQKQILMKTIDDIFRIARIVISISAAFFIVINGRWSQVHEMFVSPSFYVAVFISFFICYILMYFIHFISHRLDRRWSWDKKPFRRIILQILGGVVPPVLFDVLFAVAFIITTGRDFMTSGFIERDLGVILSFIILVNGFYPLYFFLSKYLLSDHSIENDCDQQSCDLFTVDYNGNHVNLNPVSDILFLYRENKLVKVQTISGSIYSIQTSIAQIIEHLPTDTFCQINRSVIVNLAMLKGYSAINRKSLRARFKTEYHPIIKDRDDNRYRVTMDHIEKFKNLMQDVEKL